MNKEKIIVRRCLDCPFCKTEEADWDFKSKFYCSKYKRYIIKGRVDSRFIKMDIAEFCSMGEIIFLNDKNKQIGIDNE